METANITFTVPAYAADDDYRECIPVPVEALPITHLADYFRMMEDTNLAAAADAAALFLRALGERADTHVITGADCAYVLATGATFSGPTAGPSTIWEAAADAEHRLCEHYPWADMQDYLVLPYDTKAEEIAAVCSECTAFLVNAERPDDPAYRAALDAFDSDPAATPDRAPRLRMHYGMISAEHTEGVCAVCEHCLYDGPDDGRANIWAY